MDEVRAKVSATVSGSDIATEISGSTNDVLAATHCLLSEIAEVLELSVFELLFMFTEAEAQMRQENPLGGFEAITMGEVDN